MATKIFKSGNYIILDNGINEPDGIPTKDCRYSVISSQYTISDNKKNFFSVSLPFSDIKDEAGASYSSEAVFLTFLRDNTGFNPPQAGGAFLVEVSSKSDLPTAAAGVITLLGSITYEFLTDVDLTGDRFVGGQDTVIKGTSSENASITSTGLGTGVALFTSVFTTPMRNIEFKDVDTLFDINGLGNNVALDWVGVNFSSIPNIGTIKNITNFIYINGAFLGSKGMKFDGTQGTIAFETSLLSGDGAAGDIIKVLSTATVSTRFRIIYSSVIATGSTVGITLDASATISDETFILDTVNFAGGGTFLGDVDETSNKSLFIKCNPITNTFVNGQLFMQGNSTVTTISTINTFVKVLGTTTASVDNSKFSHTNNRLTCEATIDRKYLIQCNLSFSSGNNKECEFGFFDSKLSAVRVPSRTKSTSNSAGKAENVSFSCVVNFIKDDFLEIHGANNTDTTDITVTELNFVITEIG